MAELRIDGGRVFYWDPRRNRLPILRRYHLGRRVGNFGDLLGALIARRVLATTRPTGTRAALDKSNRVFAVGSILHFAADGDTVWGSGINGKVATELHQFATLDVRATRGPLTRGWLAEHKKIEAPEVYGDPALLLPDLLPESAAWLTNKRRGLGVVPNFHDINTYSAHPGFIDPKREPMKVLEDIANSEMIAASSLHGVIVAEAFGIPAVLLPSKAESPFKYRDYAGGTGREALVEADDLAGAERALRQERDPALAAWDPSPLRAAFPLDRFARS